MNRSKRGLISQGGQKRYVTLQPRMKEQRWKSSLLELPMDIILEVLSHVEPFDLLNLLATARTFKNLLLKKSSRPIWRRARANIPDLPECPDDLTEISYARLVFESHCQACDQGRSYELRTVRMWSARVRLCTDCLDADFVQKETGRKAVRNYPAYIKMFIPTRTGWHGHECIYKPLDELWAKEYRKLKKNEIDRWGSDKLQERRMIDEHSKRITRWYQDVWEPELMVRKKHRVRQREEQILDRLEELGWGEELQINRFCDNVLDDRKVRKACEKGLNDQVLEEIVEYLGGFLKKAKERRLRSMPLRTSSPLAPRQSTRHRSSRTHAVDS